jgi:hypothetical protein
VRRKACRGLTFIEVEIALLLLLLGVLAIVQLAPLVLEGVRLSEQHALAGQYAQHIMENELAYSHATLLGSGLPNGHSGAIGPSAGNGIYPIPGAPSGLYVYSVQRVALQPPANWSGPYEAVGVTVEVRWRDPNIKRFNRATADRVVRLVGTKSRLRVD